MSDQYVLLCQAPPVGGACPSGSEAWIDVAVISGVPELSTTEIELLLGAILTMVAISVGIRFLIKQFIK